jgi:esterase/lipase
MKRVAQFLLGLLVAVVIVFLLGPRVEVDTTITSVTLPADLDAYLAESEAAFADLIPGSEKRIVWAGAAGEKTPLSIIYLHGYSATRQETAPLAEELAAALGANLFETRFAGHGRTGDALAAASVNDWLNDTVEALEIGRRLGDEVIILGVSTGATAATWLAAQPGMDDVHAFILLSPNYAPADGTAEILTWPWAERIAVALIGPERSWQGNNALHERYWTNSYPTGALLPMMGLVKLARRQDLSQLDRPTLVIYSPNDQVVNPQRTEELFLEIGAAQKELIPITDAADPNSHVLAGDILAPEGTAPVQQLILDFLGK